MAALSLSGFQAPRATICSCVRPIGGPQVLARVCLYGSPVSFRTQPCPFYPPHFLLQRSASLTPFSNLSLHRWPSLDALRPIRSPINQRPPPLPFHHQCRPRKKRDYLALLSFLPVVSPHLLTRFFPLSRVCLIESPLPFPTPPRR